jgi:hypothetical protein
MFIKAVTIRSIQNTGVQRAHVEAVCSPVKDEGVQSFYGFLKLERKDSSSIAMIRIDRLVEVCLMWIPYTCISDINNQSLLYCQKLAQILYFGI